MNTSRENIEESKNPTFIPLVEFDFDQWFEGYQKAVFEGESPFYLLETELTINLEN